MTQQDWKFVVLGPDENGDFRWIAGDTTIETKDEAETLLIAELARITAFGEPYFRKTIGNYPVSNLKLVHYQRLTIVAVARAARYDPVRGNQPCWHRI
jgi:hypothetical protein